MRSIRFTLSVVPLLLSSAAFAQSEAHKMDPPKAVASRSDAQTSFDIMKSLAGEWEGPVKTNMPDAAKVEIKPLHVTMRVTSRGNVLVHELQEAGTPLDPANFDHPVTMLYVDADRLNLVHYCDAGNRPRMTGEMSPDGRTLEFELADLSGSNEYGHMYQAVFTIIDEKHHTEDWTYMAPGDKPVRAHFDLRRVKRGAPRLW